MAAAVDEPAPGSITTRRDLARALTMLRERARKTIRDVARDSGVPPATVGGYCSGRHVPALTHVEPFVAVLSALGVDDPAPWLAAVERVWWTSASRQIEMASPYKGLESYEARDAKWFFGRSEQIDELLDLVRAHAVDGGVITVVGASGAGKSSLLRAGVLAAVDRGVLGPDWRGCVFTPGREPLTRLDLALAEIAAGDSAVVVVDQFEELFTESVPTAERDEFIELLRGLGSSRVVVLGMRADFYAAATRVPPLVPLLQHAQVVVGPLADDALRAAIVEPARMAGVEIGAELVTRVIGDLAPRDRASRAHDISALPLLSHAMRTTWEAAGGAEPTIAHYESIGGIAGAIARSADEVYGALDPRGRALARRMFLRLLHDDGDLLTRRNVPWSELIDPDQDDPLATEVIEAFVVARLLTADSEAVRVAHEALLTSWPRIGEWIEGDREGLRLQRQIGEAAGAWDDAGRDPTTLWRGGRLEAALGLASRDDRGGLNRREREFVEASRDEDRRESDLSRSRARRLAQLLAAVATLAIVAVAMAGFAIGGQRSAQQARDEALSRQIAIHANLLAQADPALAQQLALAGFRISPTVESRSALLDIASRAAVTRFSVPTGPASVSVSADGLLIATGNVDGALRLFSQNGAEAQMVGEVVVDPDNQMYGVALSPDGRLAAIGGTGTVVRLVDTSDPSAPRLLDQELPAEGIEALTFSPDGKLLVGSSKFQTAYRWAVDDGVAVDLGALTGFGGPLHVSAFSPDSTLLATASNDGVLRVWDAVSGGSAATPLASVDFGAVSNHVLGVSFSPDGTRLVAGTRDGHVRLFEVGADALTPIGDPFGDFSAQVNAVAFGSRGDEVIAGSSDTTVRVFDADSGKQLDRLPNTTPITSLAYLGDSREVLVGSPDGYIRIWRRADARSPVTDMTVSDMALSADGRVLAAGTRTAVSGVVTLWDTTDPYRPVRGADATADDVLLNGSVALTDDGSLLAAGTTTGDVLLFALAAGEPQPVGRLRAADVTVQHLDFDTSGTMLVVATDDAVLSLWNIVEPHQPVRLDAVRDASDRLLGATFAPGAEAVAASSADARVYLYAVSATGLRPLAVIDEPENFVHAVAFSPDGSTLAVGSADRRVRLFDVADPAAPVLLGSALRGPTGYVYDVSFSADGTHVAAVADGVVWIWETGEPSSPELVGTLRAATGSVTAVRISPVDDAVIAAGSDARLLVWDPHPDRVASRQCALSGVPINEDEWAQYVTGADYAPPC